MSKLELKCTDNELEGLIREQLSKNNWFFPLSNIDGVLFELFINKELFIKESGAEYTSIELTLKDQFRINKMVSKMITNGDLIFNVVGRRYFGDGIEVAWAGEKTPISD